VARREREYPGDTFRLLYAIGEYTKPREGEPGQRWLKEQAVSVIVTLGVKGAVFRTYDLAPSLIMFRGVKMFAMMSQEALGDVAKLYQDGMIEKSRINTSFYATIRAYRITRAGLDLVKRNLSRGSMEGIDRIIRCEACGTLVDFALSEEAWPQRRLAMNRVCACTAKGQHTDSGRWPPTHDGAQASVVEDFFSIGFLEYRAEAFWGDCGI